MLQRITDLTAPSLTCTTLARGNQVLRELHQGCTTVPTDGSTVRVPCCLLAWSNRRRLASAFTLAYISQHYLDGRVLITITSKPDRRGVCPTAPAAGAWRILHRCGPHACTAFLKQSGHAALLLLHQCHPAHKLRRRHRSPVRLHKSPLCCRPQYRPGGNAWPRGLRSATTAPPSAGRTRRWCACPYT